MALIDLLHNLQLRGCEGAVLPSLNGSVFSCKEKERLIIRSLLYRCKASVSILSPALSVSHRSATGRGPTVCTLTLYCPLFDRVWRLDRLFACGESHRDKCRSWNRKRPS